MISFKKGKPVAIVCGGDYDNKTIHITEEDEKPDRNIDEEDIYDLLDDEDFNLTKYKRLPLKDRLKLARALKRQIEPLEDYLAERYHRNSIKLDNKLKKELTLETGCMVPIPAEETERIYIAGKSGSGKSCLAAIYAREYHSMFPKRKIIIFTKHEKDKAYEGIPHREVLCDDPILKKPIKVTSLSNRLVIFDDCDHIQDKTINDNVRRLNDDLITTGRKYNIHVLTLQHQLLNYKDTRNLLNEANKVVFFNSSCNYHITRYLKTYVGLAPEMIKKITGLKSRWTMISLSIPSYIMHEHGIFII